MEQAYAVALWKLVEGGMTPHKAVASIKEVLASDGRSALFPRVARAFTRLAAREAKKSDLVLTIARESDERGAKKEAGEVISSHGMDARDLKTRVDDTVIGGWRLEGRGLLVDASYKSRLVGIYGKVTR